MQIRRPLTIAILMFAPAAVLHAEDPPVFSGPQAGEKLPPLEVSLVYGDRAGEVVDFVELAGGKPALLVIVNGSNRPAANLTRCLMNFAEMHEDRLFAGTVYLDKDLSAAENSLKRGISWWGMGPPVGIAVDGGEGPGSYGLNRNVNLTILVAHEGTVVANYALIQPSITDAPKILGDVVDLIGTEVPGETALGFLSMPTRKPGNVPWRAAPADVTMRKLICQAIAAADDDEVQAAAEAIEQYVGDDPDRQATIGNAAAVLLQGGTYRTKLDGPMVGHLQRWRSAYETPDRRRRAR